jgi:hypothetical protein
MGNSSFLDGMTGLSVHGGGNRVVRREGKRVEEKAGGRVWRGLRPRPVAGVRGGVLIKRRIVWDRVVPGLAVSSSEALP